MKTLTLGRRTPREPNDTKPAATITTKRSRLNPAPPAVPAAEDSPPVVARPKKEPKPKKPLAPDNIREQVDAIHAKNQKANKHKVRALDALSFLRRHWPALFRADRALPLPLGVYDLLLADAAERGINITKNWASCGIAMHTDNVAYQQAIIDSTHRANLDGSPGEEIPDQHKEHARRVIASLNKREAARQARNQSLIAWKAQYSFAQPKK